MIDVASAGSHRTNCTTGAVAGASSSAAGVVAALTGRGTTGRTTNVYVEPAREHLRHALGAVFTLSTATRTRISEAARRARRRRRRR